MSTVTVEKKMDQKIVWIFGLSEITALFLAGTGTSYFSYYITNILMLSPAIMATVLLITRIFDIVTILISSVVEEKMNLKWGKYRSWLLLMCPPATVFGALMYSGILGTAMANCYLAAVCYVLMFGFFNFGRTAQLALLNAIGKTAEERAVLSARKGQFASANRIITSALYMPMIFFFSGGAGTVTAGGFWMAALVFDAAYILSQMWLFAATKNYDLPGAAVEVGKPKNSLSGKEMLEQVFKNPPLMIILITETCKSIGPGLFNAYVIYYFTIVAQDLTVQPIFQTTIAVFTLFGALIMGSFVRKKVGKKVAYSSGFLAYTIALVCARLFASGNVTAFMIIMGCGNFVYAGVTTTGPAMFGDCVEYGKYKIGKEGRAFIMGLYTLPIKIGTWVYGALSGVLLAWIGYDASLAITPELQAGMFNIITVAPSIVMGASFILSLLYPLTESKVKEVMAENAARAAE